ncbi:class I SAM-dependent methyltransferase [Patescibacteria group bacterium]
MNNKEYEKLYKFEHFYWWHIGRRDIANSFLERFLKNKENQILEIGCGTGGNLEVLNKWGQVIGLDISKEALNFCKKRGFTNLILGKAEKISLSDNSCDLVLALDVLEHTKDDKRVIKESWRVLKGGGFFLAIVPAYKFLWSEHDEALGHKRRYSILEFKKKLREADFKIIKISHLVTFVFPLVLGYRILRKTLFPKSKKNTAYVFLPGFINDFFIFLLKLESFLLKYFNLPFGTSIICLAQKPKLKKY